jgi:hypothetical protein
MQHAFNVFLLFQMVNCHHFILSWNIDKLVKRVETFFMETLILIFDVLYNYNFKYIIYKIFIIIHLFFLN